MKCWSVLASLPLVLLLGGPLVACDGGDDGVGGAGGGAGGAGDVGGAGGAGGGTASTSSGVTEAPTRFFLRIEDGPPPPIVLELDKQKALEVFGEEAAREIRLLDVDSTAMLGNVLTRIQNACGTGWQADSLNPGHDCAATALGQSFGAAWQTTPEFAMVRLLSMTPANADVTGTSLEDFEKLISENPSTFSITFGGVLAESMGIPKTAPFVPLDQLVAVLKQQLMGTHPAIGNAEGLLPITMFDALNDMTPLATKLGPVGAAPWSGNGEHPGVLVPDSDGFTTRSDALTPAFTMRVVAESNLRWVSGVDLSEGAGDMFLREGDAALAFDFLDPERLDIQGVAEAPTMDMRFSLREQVGIVPSCVETEACKGNYPSTPVGNDTLWTLRPFLLESIVGRAGLLTYEQRMFEKCYFTYGGVCRTGVEIGQAPDPTGWTVFMNQFQFSGEPPLEVPAPQFLWELLSEVAQVAVHDPDGDGVPDIDEGAAAPVFALHEVPIGLTGPDLVAQMRPALQSQEDYIAEVILGRFWKNNDALDFFYRRADEGGQPYLYFVAESDLRPDPSNPDAPRAYTYERPGFFKDVDLGEEGRLSAKNIDGVEDTEHEKLLLPQGETVLYMQDDEGARYEVRFFVPEAGSLEITADVHRVEL
ncbi:hypothetical protein [Chondromyces apiculatus]|uniref:Lipoprotein n=1 Tax=Chondromyces apiculatus DSM 436 TaxID=1192034 RepID=A0A017TAG5_9BACT|nr:hypothetical protein [Chondromyces apiculatus]EYF06278.1 Hypothetical protein CAP_2156 [Chondromyces apiculatus DSM 436]